MCALSHQRCLSYYALIAFTPGYRVKIEIMSVFGFILRWAVCTPVVSLLWGIVISFDGVYNGVARLWPWLGYFIKNTEYSAVYIGTVLAFVCGLFVVYGLWKEEHCDSTQSYDDSSGYGGGGGYSSGSSRNRNTSIYGKGSSEYHNLRYDREKLQERIDHSSDWRERENLQRDADSIDSQMGDYS